MKTRKYLSANGLFKQVRQGVAKIKDHRTEQAEIPLADALMSGFALFSLKDPSLLAFEARRKEPENLQNIYGIKQIPSDTQMRTILDEVSSETLRPIYKDLFRQVQRGKVLEAYKFMGKYYLTPLDGTGYFSSKKIHCANCLQKRLRNGETLYHHQMLGAVIVHPDLKTVIPLMPEPIIKQDGSKKNDCERNAAKRFLTKLRQDHPHLPLIVTEDGLSSNAPHIRELKRHNLRFILGAKERDHTYLFERVRQAEAKGESVQFEIKEGEVTHRFHYANNLPLNASNTDLLVNFLEYWEIKGDKTQYFSWITDFTISRRNAYDLMRGGRARWKIENETFNTLKNQGYHYEHNFGHGQKHLSVVFASLMMVAFLVDQIQQAACQLFQAVLAKVGSKKRLWEKMRALFATIEFAHMELLYKAMLYGYRIEKIVIFEDTG